MEGGKLENNKTVSYEPHKGQSCVPFMGDEPGGTVIEDVVRILNEILERLAKLEEK